MLSKNIKNNIFKLLILFIVLSIQISAKEAIPYQLTNVGINEKLGNTVSLDIKLKDELGNEIALKNLISTKPILINFVYYSCPMLCNLLADGLVDGLNASEIKDKDLQLISISIDHKDNKISASAFKEKYIKKLNNSSLGNNWKFLTGNEEDIRKVADSIGFNYQYDKKSKEYAHSAGIIFLTPQGKISRYLYGISFNPFDLKLGTLEAKDKKLKSSVEKVLLFCYNYDPDTQGYVLYAVNFMKIGALLCLIATFCFIGRFFYIESKKDWNRK